MKRRRINWIPGWASSFSIWKETILKNFPNRDHIFWEYDELRIFDDPHMIASITDKFSDDIFIAWSLGTQLLFENQKSFSHIHKIICIAPIFKFCSQPHGWSTLVIDRMIKAIKKDPVPVIEQFAKSMGTDPHEPVWIEYALSISKDDLIWGLEKLKSGKISDLSHIEKKTECIFGNLDTIITPAMVKSFADIYKFITFSAHATLGHWPLNQESIRTIQRQVDE